MKNLFPSLVLRLSGLIAGAGLGSFPLPAAESGTASPTSDAEVLLHLFYLLVAYFEA